MSEPLLRVKDLTKNFDIGGGLLSRDRHVVHAVDSVSFEIGRAETLGLVGKSGSREVDDRALRAAVDRADVWRNPVRESRCRAHGFF